MGVHSPFGYVGYTRTMAKTIVYLLDNFCMGCHTNDDFEGKCELCPVGILIHYAKEYIADTNVHDKQLAEVVEAIKEEVANIEPSPFFNADLILFDKRQPDKLGRLRELIADLDFLESKRVHPLILKQETLKRLYTMLEEGV